MRRHVVSLRTSDHDYAMTQADYESETGRAKKLSKSEWNRSFFDSDRPLRHRIFMCKIIL